MLRAVSNENGGFEPVDLRESSLSDARATHSSVGARDIVVLVRRRLRLVTLIVLCCTMAAALVAFSRSERYAATSVLVLERNDTQLFEAVAELERQTADRSAIETEMDIIHSRLFAGIVVDKFNLLADPSFNTYLLGAKAEEDVAVSVAPLSKAMNAVESVVSELRSETGNGQTDSGVAAADTAPLLPDVSIQRNRAISGLLSRLTVTRSGESLAMSITVSDENPERAAALANGAAALYVEWSLQLKQEATSRLVGFLRERAKMLASLIAESERAIADYRRQNRLAYDREDDLLSAQLTQVNVSLAEARADRAGKEARLAEIRNLLDSGVEVAGTVLTSPLLATLRGDEARQLQEKAELASRYDKNHPMILHADAEIASVRELIDDEIRRIVLDLENEVRVAAVRAEQFSAELGALDERLRGRSVTEIRLRELERILLTDQQRYEQVATRLGNLDRQQDVLKPSARVVSNAEVPSEPFSERNVIIAGGFVGSTALAIIFAVLLEGMDTRIRSGQRAAQIVGLPNLGEVPKLPSRWRRRGLDLCSRLKRQPSAFGESMRLLDLACRAVEPDNPPKVIMITSCLPEEGKTSLSIGLALAAANSGRRTLFVDLDLRRNGTRPAHVIRRSEPALEHYLLGECDLLEIIGRQTDCGFDVISTARQPQEPSRLLQDLERLRGMLQTLRTRYDMIVIDTPPVLIVNDAILFSPFVDAAILLARWGSTTEDALREAATRLRQNRAPLIGSVVTGINSRIQAAAYGYGGGTRYFKYNRGYNMN